LAEVAIDEDIIATLGAEAISCPSVTRSLREMKFAASNPEVVFSELIREHDDCDQVILLALDEQPFASIRQLARLTYLLRTTIHRGTRSILPFLHRTRNCLKEFNCVSSIFQIRR
jgi:hypothetical protein